VILPGEAQIGALVADAVEVLVRRRPEAVLGVATGSSPLPVYRELVARHRSGDGPDYGRVVFFTLDEYVGLPAGSPASYRSTITRELTDPLGIAADRVHSPDPDARGLAEAGERYETAIRTAGGVDLQILGIGSDGHLAFNEPGSSLVSRTRIKTLTEQTRRDNARFFGSRPGPTSWERVPRHVLTQGLGTIRDARHLVLVATGAGKAEAVAAAIEGPVTASCPASVLQLHEHATAVLDEAAAGLLTRSGHYREVWAGKPGWQEI
jgi:glucosamine-6-phosphate deaminase